MEVWTTKEIVGTIIATGLVSAVFTTAMSWITSAIGAWIKSRRERTYLATKVAVALESYASRCSSLMWAVGAEYQTYADIPSEHLPSPPDYPSDADWRSMKAALSYKVLTFVTEIEREQADADHARYFENNPFQVQSAAKDSGKRALELAEQVRRSIGLKIDKEHAAALAKLFPEK